MSKSTVKISDKIIKIEEAMYRVYPYSEGIELEFGNAYTFVSKFGNMTITYPYVFPYRGELKKSSKEVGIYLVGDSIHVIYPENDKERKMYSVNRIFAITPETITTELDKYLSEASFEDLKSGGNIFEPEIKDSDDVGIKAVRLAIIAKQIDFNNYATRLEKSWDRANIKKALERDSTLTFSKLKQYSQLFDFNFGIIIFDKDGAKDPISKSGKALVVFDDEVFPIEDEKVEIIGSVDDLDNLRD